MKQIFNNPKVLVPIVAVIVLVFSFVFYTHIGNAPLVPQNVVVTTSKPLVVSGSNVSLSFPKSGRVEAVLVKNGDTVKAGSVIARLLAPDALGAVKQAKGALDLAQAQYASFNSDYATTKKQQDILVTNAYQKLLSEGLEGTPSDQTSTVPIISGTYTCGTEGVYILDPYASGDNDSGYSINFSGLESGTIPLKFDTAVPLGKCGLQIRFDDKSNIGSKLTWTIAIPNVKGTVYLENKSDYDLATSTREKVLADLRTKIGSSSTGSVAQAQIDAAEGAYQAALGVYQNNVITTPVNGVVNFVDPDLKVGQSVTAGKSVISITSN